ncbi:MAG: type II toxin-antitoxin system RelB/DinJ family antitoxin [Sphaerochaetaceae bacterium]|nr:type II toxin-antitoxin system RelB/DinJ family antitoxin [Sphaerochaetaceae bacterium]
MRADAVLQVRIDSNLKKEAEVLFERLGISLADAVRMFVSQCIEQQGLPFDVKTEIPGQRKLYAYGILSKYADPSKIPLEEGAWARAVMEKYAST